MSKYRFSGFPAFLVLVIGFGCLGVGKPARAELRNHREASARTGSENIPELVRLREELNKKHKAFSEAIRLVRKAQMETGHSKARYRELARRRASAGEIQPAQEEWEKFLARDKELRNKSGEALEELKIASDAYLKALRASHDAPAQDASARIRREDSPEMARLRKELDEKRRAFDEANTLVKTAQAETAQSLARFQERIDLDAPEGEIQAARAETDKFLARDKELRKKSSEALEESKVASDAYLEALRASRGR
jgi:hypothetical protein